MKILDGTSQDQRAAAALQPGYFNVTEMGLNTLLAFGVEYAGLLRYYNADNDMDGDWTRFFTGDETMVLAHIGATDLNRAESAFQQACSQPAHLNATAAVAQASCCYRLAARLNDWHVWLGSASGKPGLHLRQVTTTIIDTRLAADLRALEILLSQYPSSLSPPYAMDFSTFAPLWGVGPHAAKVSAAAPPREVNSCAPEIDAQLQTLFHAFRDATGLVIKAAADQMDASLARNDHEPALALYIAFAKLLQKAQERINRFAPQQVQYYYRDLLRSAPTSATAHRTILVPALNGSLPAVTIPQGTPFSAGRDACGKPLIYCADNDLRVTDTAVKALHTLHFEKNRYKSPESLIGHITDAWWATLAPLDPNASPAGPKIPPQPLFGGPAGEGEADPEAAGLGLAIADPILRLGQGRRSITLRIYFAAAAGDHPRSIVELIRKRTGSTQQDVFHKIFSRMFKLNLTADTGWYEAEHYRVDDALIDPRADAQCLCLQIELPPEAPPIVAYDPQLHGGGYDHDLPMIRLSINPTSYLYPYTLLRALRFREIRLEVAVEGCRDLLVYNQHGQLKPSGPFQPFGPVPDIGSFLMVGSYEILRKELTALSFRLEWDSLPGGPRGLPEHYGAYDHAYQPHLYELQATVLSNGRWLPEPPGDQPRVKLFARQDHDTPAAAAPHSLLPAQPLYLHTPLAKSIDRTHFAYNLQATAGFFKFTLVDPPYAFGHKAYPLLLNQALTANLRKKKKSPSLPNPPLTPTVRAIEFNYRAQSAIDMVERGGSRPHSTGRKVYHLHPLGRECIYPRPDNRQRRLLPDYPEAGNLLIGLSGSKPTGPLTLFFQILPKPAWCLTKGATAFKWYYLAANQWLPLPAGCLISDTTNGFMFSGIVTLDIPEDIARGNTILPGDCFWLRVCVDGDTHHAGRLLALAAHALPVTWQKQPDCADQRHPAPAAGTICKPGQALAGIGKIIQPMAATSGRDEETEGAWITRVSERLRHKNRAVTPWDYERLVLAHFPEIYKVKCFAGISGSPGSAPVRTGVAPGRVLLVVIPQAADHDPYPMADAHLLQRIQTCITSLASPFAAIEVCNPVYEQIQIRCTVTLTSSERPGASLKRINQAINEYLSPWAKKGKYRARFGWCIRRTDLVSYLLGLESVAYITGFSMLHIVGRPDRIYGLKDTAAAGQATEHTREIRPRYPWGIAVPLKEHCLRPTAEFSSKPPIAAGIGDIKIGETFIIPGK